MSKNHNVVILNNIKLSIDASVKEAFSLANKRLKKILKIPTDAAYTVYRRSIDARNKNDIRFVYSIAVAGSFSHVDEKLLSKIDATIDKSNDPTIIYGNTPLDSRPIIVGSGPAGLFAGLLLAENGYAPIILERGGSVSERIKMVEVFKKTRKLDTNTNIQFGAGGAGTFSDGKLITRINDEMSSYVLKRLVEFGAPREILYLAKPHIGTDVLCVVVDNILKRIVELGGEVRYNTIFLDADFDKSNISKVITDSGEIKAGALILAPGHSARDTYDRLIKSNISITAKNFSVGMRIEHLTDWIDKAMFGKFAGHKALGHAEYGLSYNTKVRGVYTFCMCPGGEVVPASSEFGGVVVNGMSMHARDGKNSNSAVVCSIFKEDFGDSPEKAIEFQRRIERNAFTVGGGDYTAPAITVGDFLNDILKSEPTDVIPTYMNGGIKIASPYQYLPAIVCDNIKNALHDFDKKINCFGHENAVLTGAETRTSAPVRILRDSLSHLAIGYENFYPCGEGAGYAGGITSAAIDGAKTAMRLMNKFKP